MGWVDTGGRERGTKDDCWISTLRNWTVVWWWNSLSGWGRWEGQGLWQELIPMGNPRCISSMSEGHSRADVRQETEGCSSALEGWARHWSQWRRYRFRAWEWMSSPWAGRLARGRNRSLESNPEKPLKSRDWLKAQEKAEETASEEEEETQSVVHRGPERCLRKSEGGERRWLSLACGMTVVLPRPASHIVPWPRGSEPYCFALWCGEERTEDPMNSAKWGKECILEWKTESTLISSIVVIIVLLITTTFLELSVLPGPGRTFYIQYCP